MPVTLTLKNIPDDLYARLKAAASEHRRSLNGEAIVCLESALAPDTRPVAERLRRAREIRADLAPQRFRPRDIDAMKSRGRA
ncbi:MAG: hypothetical protein U1F06_01425 [Steroidobacteraceae bacterium]